ncbi:MAG: histidine--tRNA ligase [Desulfobacteraceae bacterium]|nr:histidine--tRNA ligase [Desulfobacteraceae bacterium]
MIQLIKGFKDIVPGEIELWQHIEQMAVELFETFGYHEIRIPIMEKTQLFARSIGEDTDIVEKEMYTFPDSKGDLITLRPEATASIVRAYIQHKMYAGDPRRKFYMVGPMFRRERPQKGRYRQFYQIDLEAFGIASPYIDTQQIHILHLLFQRLGIKDCRTHINSLGCPECRPRYRELLLEMLNSVQGKLCSDCCRRKDRNPLRVLDCKVPSCREAVANAPELSDHLCRPCRDHFNSVLSGLDHLKAPYILDKRLVRGLDYYTRTAFEIQTSALGAQSAIAGGGRYDGLIETLGGPPTPAIGFAIGFDRLAEIMSQLSKSSQTGSVQPGQVDLFIAALGDLAQDDAFKWLSALCEKGIRAEMDYTGRSLKAQMKQADRLNAKKVLIVGETELESGKGILRDMSSKQQQEIGLDDIVLTIPQIFQT